MPDRGLEQRISLGPRAPFLLNSQWQTESRLKTGSSTSDRQAERRRGPLVEGRSPGGSAPFATDLEEMRSTRDLLQQLGTLAARSSAEGAQAPALLSRKS